MSTSERDAAIERLPEAEGWAVMTTADWIKTRAALIAALTLATIAGLCALALHPALYPNDAADTGDLTC